MDEFEYYTMFSSEETKRPSGLIAMRLSMGPLQAVIWHVPKGQWIYSPAIAAIRLFDDRYADQMEAVARATAERIARENLGTELPTEEELLRMCEEGANRTDR